MCVGTSGWKKVFWKLVKITDVHRNCKYNREEGGERRQKGI